MDEPVNGSPAILPPSTPARAGLETKLLRTPLPAVSADGRFRGHASLFGREDLSGDVVERGAFAASLARRGAERVKLLFQHDPHEPVGRFLSIEEDGRGLAVVGEVTAETRRGREVMSLMRAGILDGLSIGFRTVRSRQERGGAIRRLLEIDLWEISIVTFPMLPEARAEAAKAASPHEDKATTAFHEARMVALLRRGAINLRQTR